MVAVDYRTGIRVVRGLAEGIAGFISAAESSPDFDPARVVYLTPQEDAALPETQRDVEEQTMSGTAEITRFRTGEVVVTCAADRDAWLVLAETYYPGWKAWVDDAPARVWRANHVQRAVFVPAGQHTVRFSYEPMTFRVGAAVSLISLGLAVMALVVPKRKGT